MAKPEKELTPMQRQYQQIKEQNQDCILFFRLGDFYEMFNEDAKLAARELDLTLTSRDRSKPKEEKNRRFDRLCDVQNHISLEIHQGYVGKTVRVLCDGRDKDMLTARTEGGRLVRFAGSDDLIGTYQNLTITGATTWSLTAELTI